MKQTMVLDSLHKLPWGIIQAPAAPMEHRMFCLEGLFKTEVTAGMFAFTPSLF